MPVWLLITLAVLVAIALAAAIAWLAVDLWRRFSTPADEEPPILPFPMSRESRKAQELAAWFEEAETAMARMRGGYPALTAVVASHLIIASTVDDEPRLEVICPLKAIQWHKELKARLDHGADLVDAVFESKPP